MTDAAPPPFRVGTGYDVHRFARGRRLVLGGVEIPHEAGLEGHSDADVLTHAIADAILGALGLADIGHYFPNSESAIEGIDSQRILARAVELAGENGYGLGNIDATLIAEAPKIGPWIGKMKARLGQTTGLPGDRIGLKATTNEGLGAIGRGEGIAAHAACLLMRLG